MNFNALDDSWILVRMSDGQVTELGIKEALLNAPKITEFADSSPLVVTAQLRVLLAILYRIVGEYDWEGIWQAGQWSTETKARLNTYFDQWRDRFNLFGDYPFMQYKGLTTEKPASLSRLVPEMASPTGRPMLP